MGQRVMPTPLGRCQAGIGRAEITPPIGIYHRNWGAARHDASTGLHRPLLGTVLVIQDGPDGTPWLLLTVDLGWMQGREQSTVLNTVAANTGTLSCPAGKR